MFSKLVVRVALVLAIAAPAAAQTELAGSWAARNNEDALERAGGPYAVDYAGLPLNDEGRARALAYSGDILSMIALGGNAYYLLKLANLVGMDVQDVGAQQTGLSKDEFKARLVAARG